jgi:hypothetical protein
MKEAKIVAFRDAIQLLKRILGAPIFSHSDPLQVVGHTGQFLGNSYICNINQMILQEPGIRIIIGSK